MRTMPEPPIDDEFRFLAGDAARVSRTAPLPEVRRVDAPVSQGRRISGLSFEPDRAPEPVLLHGAGLNAHGFDPTLLALGRPALALDLPGHGRSDWREDADYRPDLLAPDVALALDALAPGSTALVGHSLGGLTAILTASARADRTRALVLVDITPGVVPARDAGSVAEFITGQRSYADHEEIIDRAIAFGIGSSRESLARGIALNTRRRPDGRWEWTHHLAHLDGLPEGGPDPADAAAGAGVGTESPLAPLWRPLEALHAAGLPVALIRADAGMVDARLADEWRDRLPGSPVRTIAGPHNLHEAAPRELASVLGELIGSV
ncbi:MULTISPECIES: alpha/beta fold hydrolase [unclassified Leucobacter]|uniref:alpha/beta fold hydrolase n=1 Tax=unclassified Leucobacter TaxID=2621730 RepID=UPI001E2C50FF|nr:alpha/beta hydrolase [Leucobacter sp. Ag1]